MSNGVIRERAFAKLNISLDVISKMDNGYHEMKMIMQSASLYDDVTVRWRQGTGKISVRTNRVYLPSDSRNSAWKAADVFMKESGVHDKDVLIEIYKQIPVCAGLGGGSSDAAAVLRAMNKAFQTGFDGQRLEKIGERIGSDVPFCVAGGTALATGRGEILEDMRSLPKCYVVISKPDFSVSTPELFGKIDSVKLKCHPDTDGIIEALSAGDIDGISKRMYNVFEDVLTNGSDKVREIKEKLYEYGALGAVMSGTGSAVFGVFSNGEYAEKAYKNIVKVYPDTFLAETIEKLLI